MIHKALIAISVLFICSCSHSDKPTLSPPEAIENVKKNNSGQYLSLTEAIQGYLGGDDEYIELSWNIAEGYRIYTDVTTASYSGGQLVCGWTGYLEKRFVPQIGITGTAKVHATIRCKRPIPGKPVSSLVVRFFGGTIDGKRFPPVEYRLTKNETPQKYYSGLITQDVSDEIMTLAPELSYGGALVHSIISNSPADQAGLQAGDIITAVNDIPVRTASEFIDQFQSDMHEGFELVLDVYRLKGSMVHKRIILMRQLNSTKALTHE